MEKQIISNKNLKEKLKLFKNENTYILTDFDRTITKGGSSSSWSILSKSDKVPKEYVKERQELYEYYRPIEIDETIDFEQKSNLMTEWWTKHINLFIKYKLNKKIIDDAAINLHVMEFREGAKQFLESLNKRKIPVIIISAGIGNFIEQFLIKNNCNYENIYIISNFIKFENDIATGLCENIIHSLNKNEVNLPNNIKEKILNRNQVILLGDNISDIKMIADNKKNKAFKIGFLEEKIEENKEKYQEEFDLLGINNINYYELNQYLKEMDYDLI